jgi:hypothetical protein
MIVSFPFSMKDRQDDTSESAQRFSGFGVRSAKGRDTSKLARNSYAIVAPIWMRGLKPV